MDADSNINEGIRLFSAVYPGVIRLPCKGLLHVDGGQMEGKFELVHLIHRGPRIEVLKTELASESPVGLCLESLGNGSFTGSCDDGRSIRCANLMAEHFTFSVTEDVRFRALLQPLEDVYVGDVTNEDNWTEAHYDITDYFGKEFELSANGVSVKCSVKEQASELREWARQWRMPVESAVLSVTGVMTKQDRSALVDEILQLLSFLEGRHVSYGRYSAIDPSGRKADVFCSSRSVPAPRLSQEVLHTTPAQNVLEVALANLLRLSDSERHQLLLAISYLVAAKAESNQDAVTINLAVAWEILVDLIVKEQEMTSGVCELRKRLLGVVGRWRKKYAQADPNGLYGTRISESLRYNPFLDGMRDVMENLKLSEQELRVDLEKFKGSRDKIIHEGSARSVYDNLHDHALGNWRTAFAVDVVILKHLGYAGNVYDRREMTGGWKQEVPMSAFSANR